MASTESTSNSELRETASGLPRVLVVEDDRGVRESLVMVFGVQNYEVVGVESGEEALNHQGKIGTDLVILDLNLPGIDGVETCKQLRLLGYAGPILMLTARHDVTDRVRGLDSGADDYLPKPFALDELLARSRSLLRSFSIEAAGHQQTLRLGDVEVDLDARRVLRSGMEISLTKIEFDLLELLFSNIDRVMERNDIHLAVWGYDEDTSSNTLEVFVSSLRRKLEANGGSRLIHTKRGVGYVARHES